MIWAEARDRVIGAGGGMPWHVPEDLAHFKEVTLGAPVVMGRRTWESLPPRFRPLPGRANLVVTRDPEWAADGAVRASSLEQALALAAESIDAAEFDEIEDASAPTIWIIGGGQLYTAALPQADVLEITELDLAADGDTRAPARGPEWRVTVESGWATSRTGIRYRFRTLQR
nr:dihydrofolate reductase [Agromyces seonyuensis]